MSEQRLAISADGDLLAIYNDDLRELINQGHAEIVRASHVEPCQCTEHEGRGLWSVQMVNGPLLGCFSSRDDALAAETEYLAAQLFD